MVENLMPHALWQTLLSCMNSKRGHENCNMTDHLKHALAQAHAEGRAEGVEAAAKAVLRSCYDELAAYIHRNTAAHIIRSLNAPPLPEGKVTCDFQPEPHYPVERPTPCANPRPAPGPSAGQPSGDAKGK